MALGTTADGASRPFPFAPAPDRDPGIGIVLPQFAHTRLLHYRCRKFTEGCAFAGSRLYPQAMETKARPRRNRSPKVRKLDAYSRRYTRRLMGGWGPDARTSEG